MLYAALRPDRNIVVLNSFVFPSVQCRVGRSQSAFPPSSPQPEVPVRFQYFQCLATGQGTAHRSRVYKPFLTTISGDAVVRSGVEEGKGVSQVEGSGVDESSFCYIISLCHHGRLWVRVSWFLSVVPTHCSL